jgi:hypothetical protein
MDREKIDQADDSLEAALRQFAPQGNLDRDRLMFQAGRESERPVQTRSRAAWMWPAATFTMTGLAACFAIALGLQLAQPPRERIVVREAPAPPSQELTATAPAAAAIAQAQPGSAAPLLLFPASSLLQMRNVALRFGVEALPSEQAASTASSPPLSPIEPWQQLRAAPVDSDSSL